MTMTSLTSDISLTQQDLMFARIAKKILANPRVQEMKKFTQHGDISCYTHCLMVAIYSYKFAQKLGINLDIESLVKGALLHDFFLYDWHKKALTFDGWHGFSHPITAERNARYHFRLTKKQLEIISTHMWPLTFTRVPTSTEGWLVCIADKYCSLKETLQKKAY